MLTTISQQSEALKAALAPYVSGANLTWVEESGRCFREGSTLEECYARFAEVSGRLGTVRVRDLVKSEDHLHAHGLPREMSQWDLDEWGRVALLTQAAGQLSEDRLTDLVEGCYFQGETRERQGVVRSLWYLPRTERLLQIGQDAARTHVQPIFEALACENAYPADAFPETSFNHLVLKALFTEVRLPRIVDLPRRITAELRRMVADFAAERRAAGRPIPADVTLILAEKDGVQ